MKEQHLVSPAARALRTTRIAMNIGKSGRMSEGDCTHRRSTAKRVALFDDNAKERVVMPLYRVSETGC